MSIAKPLFLVGLRASGKTSLGKKLASSLVLPLYDTDEMIQEKYKMTIADMVAAYGWQYFRNKESEALKNIPLIPCIISTGGGIILREENRHYIKSNGFCVYLNPSIDSLVLRLMYNPLQSQRPQLQTENPSTKTKRSITGILNEKNASKEQQAFEEESKEKFHYPAGSIAEEVTRTFHERDAFYKEIADLTIDTSKEIHTLVEQIVAFFEEKK